MGHIKSLFKRLYSLAHHPNAYKRLGFALALIHLLPTLEGFPPVIDTFLFEILQNAIFCLRLSDADDESTGILRFHFPIAAVEGFLIGFDWTWIGSGALDRCAQVIEGLGGIAGQYKEVLLKSSARRRGIGTLIEFVEWLILVCSVLFVLFCFVHH